MLVSVFAVKKYQKEQVKINLMLPVGGATTGGVVLLYE
jgi:hypothetical protein